LGNVTVTQLDSKWL